MPTVAQIYDLLDAFAPFSTAMSFDNCGLQLGDKNAHVHRVLITLDVTPDAVAAAIAGQADLIISHHPLLFTPLRSVTADSAVYPLLTNGIALIAAHTNLDLAEGGVNTALADAIGLQEQCRLEGTEGLGVVGSLEKPLSVPDFAKLCRERLGASNLRFTDHGRTVDRVAVVGGEGSDFVLQIDPSVCYLTGEIKHHLYAEAVRTGRAVVTAGHHETEVVVLPRLAALLQKTWPDLPCTLFTEPAAESL